MLLTCGYGLKGGQIQKMIRERIAMFNCGRQQAPDWIRKMLKRYERYLDIRWSYESKQWLVERYSRPDRCWLIVSEWNKPLSYEVIEDLRERDMWRFPNQKAYMEYKRMRAARRREQNFNDSQEKMLEAVDSLSKKEAEEFLEVERAFKTGETVVFMGDDAVRFDRITQGSKKAAENGTAIDPSKAKVLSGKKFSHRVH